MADNNNASTNTNQQPAAAVVEPQPVQQPAAQTQQQAQPTVPAQPAAKTFTQDEVNAIAAREKNEGRKSVLNKYGLTEEQLSGIAQVLNPTASPAGAAQQPQAVDNTETLRRLLIAETKAELAISGVKADAVEDMATLVTARLKLDGYTKEDIQNAVKEIKTRHSASFGIQTNIEPGAAGVGTNNIGTGGTGGNFAGNAQTPRATGAGESGGLGKRLAARRPKSTTV